MKTVHRPGMLLATAMCLIGAAIFESESARSDDDRITRYRHRLGGGVHDFTDPDTGFTDACRACHVPHIQAMRPTTRPTTQPTTMPAYEIFRIGGQRRVFVADRYTPGPTSLICLGCHDGTVATSIINAAHSMLAGVREGFAMPEGHMWRDHPIGVVYRHDPREYRSQGFVEAQGIRLPGGRIECISCHDPHDEHEIPGMLVKSNRKSALCLTCHIK